jgi:hypothetical protein
MGAAAAMLLLMFRNFCSRIDSYRCVPTVTALEQVKWLE